MRIGLGIGLPRGSRKKAPGGSGAPPILLTADLILDSRQGVEAPGSDDVTLWLNLGTGGAAINFIGREPYLQYDAADPLFNAKPSVENAGDPGLVENGDLAQLNYLHNGSSFTAIICVQVPADDAAHRHIMADTDEGSQASGFYLRFDANTNALQFYVFNDSDDENVIRITAPVSWVPGQIIAVAVMYDGADYRILIDGVLVAGPTPPLNAQDSGPRERPVRIGTDTNSGLPLNSKLSHVSMWESVLTTPELTAVSDYLLETFKPLFPAVFLDADLVLDSRIGVQIDGSDDVTDWRNHGQGGTGLDFFGAGTPLMAYDPADALLNGKPSLEQLAGTGALANNNFTTLNYLHDGSEFTMVCCIRAPADSATHRTVIADTSFLSLVSGFNLRFEANSNALIFRVWTTGEDLVIVVSATQTWVPGQILTVSITYDGSDYRLWIDEFLADTPSPPLFPHDADNRTLAVRIGTNEIATEFYGDKLAHISVWDRELNNFERGDVRDYLLETFKP